MGRYSSNLHVAKVLVDAIQREVPEGVSAILFIYRNFSTILKVLL